MYSLSHYDAATNRLYLFDQRPTRISHQHVTTSSAWTTEPMASCSSGTPSGSRSRLAPQRARGSPWPTRCLGSIRLREQGLSRSGAGTAVRELAHAMFFPELFPTRPMLAMIGEKGSGKTSVLRRIGQLLFGPKFEVMGMSDEPKDFDAAVTSDAFVGDRQRRYGLTWLR